MNSFNLKTYEKIYYYENVVNSPYELIELIESTDSGLDDNTSITSWKKWTASDDSYQFGYQKFVNPSISNEKNKSLLSIYNTILESINSCSYHYAKENSLDIGFLTPLSISKYSSGKEMGPHVDSYEDERSPILSIVLYLNDNYEGGELSFEKQGVSIKPSAGSLIAFPSIAPYYHESKKINSGIKYMSPGFWYKRVDI
jgi:predicted 2-oxoglutarate/Fe(II)-dependent dioxygenase YbiX